MPSELFEKKKLVNLKDFVCLPELKDKPTVWIITYDFYDDYTHQYYQIFDDKVKAIYYAMRRMGMNNEYGNVRLFEAREVELK